VPSLVDALEAVFVLLFLAGVALVHVPAALVLGGVLGALACERASAKRRAGAVGAAGRGGER
jgi:hypothetical protein